MPESVSGVYDPNKSGVPENTPKFPIGTLDELRAYGIDEQFVPCCARRNKAAGIEGCRFFESCRQSYKGQTLENGGGPRRHAWERILPKQRGGGITRHEGECFQIAKQSDNLEADGGVIRIIADEGKTYEFHGGHAVKTFVDAEGKTVKQVAKHGEEHLPNVKREDIKVTRTVAPFVRVGDNPDVANFVVAGEAIKEMLEERRAEAPARALGLPSGRAPIDRQKPRFGKGSRGNEGGGTE